MARKLKDDDLGAEGTRVETDPKERARIISACAGELRNIKAERKMLNEHASAIRERLKNCGINVKSVETAIRLADVEDTAARDDYLSGLQEAWDALEGGAQLDWVSAMRAADEGEEERDLRPRYLRNNEATKEPVAAE